MHKSNLTGNSILNIIKTMATYVFPLITFMYASRVFLADGLGKIDFSQAYTAYFTLFGMLGIEKYGIREVAKTRDDRVSMSHLSHEIILLNLASVLISYILFFSSLALISKLNDYRILLLINSISIGFTAIGLNWLYMAVEDYQYITIRTCVVNIVALIALFLFVHDKSDLYTFVVIQTLAATGANIFNLIHSQKYIDYKYIGPYNPFKHLKPVLLIFGMTLFIEAFTHLDKTMLGFISGDTATGLYSAAHKVSGVITAIITAAIMVFMPRITYYSSLNENDKIKKISSDAINIILLLSIPSALGLCALSKEMIIIFSGDGFLVADSTAKILSLRILMSSLNAFIVLCLFIPIGKEINNLISTGTAAILNLLFNAIFIPLLAQDGAAVGTVLAEAVELVINLYFLNKVMQLKPLFRNTWQYFIASIPIIPVTLFMKCYISNAFLLVIMIASTSAIIYFFLLHSLKNPYLKAAIGSFIRKKNVE